MVFYDYIKGVSAESGNPITKIIFQKKSGEGKNDAYPLITADGNDKNLGQILTTEGSDQTINKNLIFKHDNNITHYISIDEIKLTTLTAKSDDNTINIPKILSNTAGITLTTGKNKTLALGSDGNVNASGSITTEGNIKAKNVYLNNATANDGEVGVIKTSGNGFIQAPYFVATSDRRAKENIVSLPPLLNYVRSIPVYSFNFRDNPSEPSIGIMAQDVESRFVGPFNLVQQPADPSSYKAIRESKLVYILWKAVQDLADEVDSLKWRLSKLEQGEGGN